jgi:hypothetical protein
VVNGAASLATTGFDALDFALFGGLLMVLGMTLLLWTRLRRPRDEES